MEEAKLIGICGGSGSGKTTIVNEIENALKVLVSFVKDAVG